MLVTLRSHLVSIQAVKDANSNINWAGERKGDKILAGEELKLPNELKENHTDNSKSKGARSGNPLIGPTVARANFEQRLSKSLYGGDVAANGGGGNWISNAWNSPGARMMFPDFLAIGGGFNGIAGAGGGTSIEFRWVTRGSEASWKPMISVTQSIGGGYSVDATLNIEAANYIGNVNNITRSMMQTDSSNGDFPTIWGAGGVTAEGKIGVTGYVTPNVGGPFIFGRELNLGVGLPFGPLPVNAAGGASNTWILYDFYK